MKHLVSSVLAVLQSNVISAFLIYLYLQFSPTLYIYSAKHWWQLLLSIPYWKSDLTHSQQDILHIHVNTFIISYISYLTSINPPLKDFSSSAICSSTNHILIQYLYFDLTLTFEFIVHHSLDSALCVVVSPRAGLRQLLHTHTCTHSRRHWARWHKNTVFPKAKRCFSLTTA